MWDGPRSAKDVATIVREQRKFWGQLPYDKYVFMNLIVESGGGLEHKNSTVLMTSRWATRTAKAYRSWLELVSHEFFHVWNVKRLRPVELGPFDYENEVHTKSLWVAEGLTEYYGRLLLRRAGLETVESFLAGDPATKPGEPPTEIAALQLTPGRMVQPLESASYDAWIKFYRPDENSRNTAVSYYTKGAVVGFLLDAQIRRATSGAKSLDDVIRLAYDKYSGEHGFTSEEFRALASEVAGADLSGWLTTALETVEELDFAPALDYYGAPVQGEGASEGRSAAEGLALLGDEGGERPFDGRPRHPRHARRGGGFQRRRRDRGDRRVPGHARAVGGADGAVPAGRNGLDPRGPARPPDAARRQVRGRTARDVGLGGPARRDRRAESPSPCLDRRITRGPRP